MRWQRGRRSGNLEDRRGQSIGRRAGVGGIGALVLVLAALYFGVDPSVVLQNVQVGPATQAPASPTRPGAGEDELAQFVEFVQADTQDTWHAIFRAMGKEYRDPTLVLFTGATRSACGMAQAAMGPFYCPSDQKVYIDLQFYSDLKHRFNAPGDFAQAYVIAHEIGHHVQTLLGISQRVHLSVRQELQADCFAGVWAHHADRARHLIEAGDVEEALGAAAAIGDDRLQRQSRGYVSPDSFTHGSSEQRVRWFRRGLETGSIGACDTFAVASP